MCKHNVQPPSMAIEPYTIDSHIGIPDNAPIAVTRVMLSMDELLVGQSFRAEHFDTTELINLSLHLYPKIFVAAAEPDSVRFLIASRLWRIK